MARPLLPLLGQLRPLHSSCHKMSYKLAHRSLHVSRSRPSMLSRPYPLQSSSIPVRQNATSHRSYATSPQKTTPRMAYLAVLALVAAAMSYYYETRQASETSTSIPGGTPVATTSHGKTFDIVIRGRRDITHTFSRLSDTELEKMLHENESGEVVARRGNPVVRWDRNWVGSNEPCEDRSAIDLLSEETTEQRGLWRRGSGTREEKEQLGVESSINPNGNKDIMMFSVFDGHAGGDTSQLLSTVLHPSLKWAFKDFLAQGTYSGWLSPLKYMTPSYWSGKNLWTSENVSKVIQDAYLSLDREICQTPIKLLKTLGNSETEKDFVSRVSPAISGSCAISTVIDADADAIYVALAGDCRAVAGWQTADGKWRCDILTEDQMGENPREVWRLQSEHPASERDTVIRNGRIQGGLQPTRAFGDAVYKWTREENDAMTEALAAQGGKARKQRPNHLTPPYVTAKPEVTVRRINRTDGEQLKFIVMATDGLWDRITSEEATLLLASYMKHPVHPDIPKSYLPESFSLLAPALPRLYPTQDLPGTGERKEGTWVYEGDQNAATHLIRNSLAGGDRKLRGELLSLRGDVTRWLRDDITVTVIFFDKPSKSS